MKNRLLSIHKPKPCQISAEYNSALVSWKAGNFDLLHLFQPFLTSFLCCDWSKLNTVISLAKLEWSILIFSRKKKNPIYIICQKDLSENRFIDDLICFSMVKESKYDATQLCLSLQSTCPSTKTHHKKRVLLYKKEHFKTYWTSKDATWRTISYKVIGY